MNHINQKEIAKEFLSATSAGRSRSVFDKYVSLDFRHHNAYFKGDRETIILAMEESTKNFPNRVIKIHHVIEENNMVVTYSNIQLNPGVLEVAAMHIFKFENNKIIEMWDIGQILPEEQINENGLF